MKRKQQKVFPLLSAIFIAAGILLFSLAIIRYQVVIKSRAAGSNINFFISGEKFGKVDQQFGIVVTDINNTTSITEIKNLYAGKNMYLKLNSPTVDTIDSPNFTTLEQAGFKWYMAFPDYATATPTLSEYYKKYQNTVYAELTNLSAVTLDGTNSLKTQFPNVKFMAASFMYWPRGDVKTLKDRVPFPTLEAITFRTQPTAADVFDDIYTMFATFYDASKDITGSSSVKIGYTAGSKLAISNMDFKTASVIETARRGGLISSAIVSAVQSKKTDTAPIKYVTAGDFTKMDAEDKKVVGYFADFFKLQPEIVWPYAISGNGDPWYNPFIPDQSNTDPLMGVIGIAADNSYMGIIMNTRNKTVTAVIPSSVNLAGYNTYSTIQGDTNQLSNNSMTFEPYETIVIYTGSATPPTATPTTPVVPPTATPTTPAGQPTNTPVPPTGVPTATPTTGVGLPTNTPIMLPTATTQPTSSPVPTATSIPTSTPVPTSTMTPIPTATPLPTLTFTPMPTNTPLPTYTPIPTNTPIPTYTPLPTSANIANNTPIKNLTVDGKPPGITPWVFITVPFALVLIGLLL